MNGGPGPQQGGGSWSGGAAPNSVEQEAAEGLGEGPSARGAVDRPLLDGGPRSDLPEASSGEGGGDRWQQHQQQQHGDSKQGSPLAAFSGHRPGSNGIMHTLEISSEEDGHFHHLDGGSGGDRPEPFSQSADEQLLREGTAKPRAPVLPGGITSRRRAYMVAIFTLVASLLFADQNLMAPNLTAIAKDFGFDDNERDKYLGGYIAAGFYLIGAPAAILFGYLCDHYNRRNLLFAAVLLGEGPCILTLFVTQYWQLLTLRLLTGISLGGTLPLVFSLLGDLYDSSSRAGVSSIVQISTGVGLAVGQGIAGLLGPKIGWRWPFAIVAVPTVAAAALMMCTTDEPARGGTEAALKETYSELVGFQYKERVTWAKLRKLLLIPTNMMVILQGLFGCLPWGMILTYLNDFLSQNKGLSVQGATVLLLALGLGGGVGVIAGGVLGQWLYNRRKWSMSVFIGVCTVSGVAPMYYLINADVASQLGLAFFMAALAGILSGTVGPNMRAMILNCNEPETRGIALALQTTLDDLGKGLGPVFVSFFIVQLGRQAAFNLATAGWIPCGLLLGGTAFSLARDEAAMQSRLSATLSRHRLAFSASDLRGASQAMEGGNGSTADLQQPLRKM